MAQDQHIDVAVVGAGGYVGAELLRILHSHPRTRVRMLVGHESAGAELEKLLPSFYQTLSLKLERFSASQIASSCRAVFLAVPHTKAVPLVAELRDRQLVVFDLSADFRLKSEDEYQKWYSAGTARDPRSVKEAIYGLCELNREAIRKADLVAVPGCYPTAALLALIPLIKQGLIETGDIVIDAKSGVSGAGRGASLGTHFSELSEGLRAYKVGGTHRHTPEIEQVLSEIAERSINVSFTPHLVPMVRGELVTSYLKPGQGFKTIADCVAQVEAFYQNEPFVRVLRDEDPDTKWVRGSNRCYLRYVYDPRTERLIAQAAIDNLTKGAAGQAVQCFNLRFGFDEAEGLSGVALFP